jgi:exopolysaccharide production protein ExoY
VGSHQRPLGDRRKRVADIVLASLALIAFAPIMLMIAVLVRVLLGAPILSAHQRIGSGGRSFSCFKFRTTMANADEVLRRHLATDAAAAQEWGETQKFLNDPTVNCLGNVLRKSSLDELPQLFSVLRGDMSLVAPRPVVTDELDQCGLSPKTTARRDRASPISGGPAVKTR